MSLIKIRVQWGDTNKVVQLDRTKPNLYERLMMQLAMTIEEDIMLFDGPMIISGEDALKAAIDDCVRTHQPHLQLTGRVNKMKKTMQVQTPRAAAPATTSTPRTAQPSTVKHEEPKPEPKKAAAPVAAGDACPECGHAINGKKFCMNCGAKAPEPKKEEPKPQPKPEPKKDLCPGCQFDWGNAKFCTNCGHKRGDAPKKDEPKPQPKEEPKKDTEQSGYAEIPKPVTKEGDMDYCGRCGKEVGGGIKAMDRAWHSECFKCVGCGCSFGGAKQLMGHEGNPICMDCYGERFGEKCDVCKKPLQGGYVKVGDMMMHPECFCCTSCGKQINSQFFRRDGKIVCGDCV